MKHTTKLRTALAGAGAAFVALLGTCTDDGGGSEQRSALEREGAAVSQGFDRLTSNQQVPVFDYSQERQTLIDVLALRAHGTHGTASAYSLDGTLLWWCPTQGAPIPSTYQLTAPYQVDWRGGMHGNAAAEIPQGEQTGVYTGDSQATWTLCLDSNGTPFAQYEEASVRWTSGVVEGLPGDKQARVDEVTFEFTPAPADAEDGTTDTTGG